MNRKWTLFPALLLGLSLLGCGGNPSSSPSASSSSSGPSSASESSTSSKESSASSAGETSASSSPRESSSSIESSTEESLTPEESSSSAASESSSKPSLAPEEFDTSYRQARDFSGIKPPSNEFDSSSFARPSAEQRIGAVADGFAMVDKTARLELFKVDGGFDCRLVDVSSFADSLSPVSEGDNAIMFITDSAPAIVYLKTGSEKLSLYYSSVEQAEYGLIGKVDFESSGVSYSLEDHYHFAAEDAENAFLLTRKLKVNSDVEANVGFDCTFKEAKGGSMEYFAPNNIFRDYSGSAVTYSETQLGAPFLMMRNKSNGHAFSLSRYQPTITYEANSFASYTLNPSSRSISIAYPAISGNRKYAAIPAYSSLVYDLAIRGEKTKDYDEASVRTYNDVFSLSAPRIVDTDISEVYRVINEDYKVFLHEQEQDVLFNGNPTGQKYTSYGLPWRIYVETGEFGPYTYQAGFIGQQLPSAYNMMYYGYSFGDEQSVTNAYHINDFWVDDAEMMSIVGVPHIWYDTWSDGFRAYPCFLRMAVDAMEGLLDSWILAAEHEVYKDNWEDALYKFADFLVDFQNEDGSYYRCYNYSGGPFVNKDDGIEEPPGNICQSTSKSCTLMPVRFLGKMYQISGDERYLNAAIAAGAYGYDNIYSNRRYQGGTCDNPNAVDKEAGVFAMYAFDTLYTLTHEEKWLTCLKQATSFTMSTVILLPFPTRPSTLKAGKAPGAGYTDGMSFIGCSASSGVDNYIAFLYYELFRLYIHTGEKVYLSQAEFVQQNTKSIMDWDGALGYPYRSLVAEASSVTSFNFSSVDNGAWVTWSSVANAEPITKMMKMFGNPDVAAFREVDIAALREALAENGVF